MEVSPEVSFGVEKTYFLKDCIVRIDFEWQPDTTASEKIATLDEVHIAIS
jgi:hypothetical protein